MLAIKTLQLPYKYMSHEDINVTKTRAFRGDGKTAAIEARFPPAPGVFNAFQYEMRLGFTSAVETASCPPRAKRLKTRSIPKQNHLCAPDGSKFCLQPLCVPQKPFLTVSLTLRVLPFFEEII